MIASLSDAEHDQAYCVRAWQRIAELQTPSEIVQQLTALPAAGELGCRP